MEQKSLGSNQRRRSRETPGNGGAEELGIESEVEETERPQTCGEGMNGTCKTKGSNDSFLRGPKGTFGWLAY
jgi:hypothetical protein